MLTPQEVSERAFQKASFGGYNMVQVDEFLDVLTGDYSTLYSENAVLKSKMKVLVDKVEEYRATEDAMRAALMTAQKMDNNIVKEAEEKRDALLAEAETRAREPLRLLKDTPPYLPPTLTPTDFLPTFSFTPGASLMLLRKRKAMAQPHF